MSVCLSVGLLAYLPACLPVCLSVCLPVCLSVCVFCLGQDDLIGLRVRVAFHVTSLLQCRC